MFAWLTRFFASKRRLIELEGDIQAALGMPTHELRRWALREVIRKHDPQRFQDIVGADGFLVTDGKTVRFDPVRKLR